MCFEETTTFSSSLAIRCCTLDDGVEVPKCKDTDEHDPKKILCQVIAKSGSSNEYVSMNISMDKNRKKNNSQLKSKKNYG
jgi:hypothetical protein